MLYSIFLFFAKIFVKFWYGFTIINRENLLPDTKGKPVLYISNHVSWLDALFMAVSLPKDVPFVVFSGVNSWLSKLMFFGGPTRIPVDSNSPYSVRKIVETLNKSGKLVIFPEGRLSTTGGMMKIQNGAGMIALKADVVIVPLRLVGVEHLKLNRLAGKVNQKSRPKITMIVGKPQTIQDAGAIDTSLKPKIQRNIATDRIEKMLIEVGLDDNLTDYEPETLTQTFFNAMSNNGKNRVILEDVLNKKFTYKELALTSIALGCKIVDKNNASHSPIGVMLPNSGTTVAVLLAISFQNNAFHPMNFSMGASSLLSVCKTLAMKKVVTSRGFVEKAGLGAIIEMLMENGISIQYLEDIRNDIGLFSKIKAFISYLRYKNLPGYKADPEDIMVVLSTSGSEGTPKGVCLSHVNMLTNVQQVLRVIDVSAQDRFLNAMPVFHSFGLMGGVLLPLIQGAWSFQYPSPLHGRIIPALSYDKNITIAFATDTFLNIWARNADSYSFYKIRAIVAGAEKVKPETKSLFAEKFGVRVLEGYGATETSPVIALNTFIHSKPGTVGKIIPGMQARIEKVPGIEKGGRLFVSGHNVMKGYMLSDNPGQLVPCGKFYDTGDIVDIDDEGFLSLLGRAKRFAKIGGEMVSLSSVENIVGKVFEDAINKQKEETGPAKANLCGNAIIAVPDDKKGEKLICFTTLEFSDTKEMVAFITAYVKTNGISELNIPRVIKHIDKLPLLATGKINYPELSKSEL